MEIRGKIALIMYPGENAKLVPKCLGPAINIDFSDTNLKSKTEKGKTEVINIIRHNIQFREQTL
jgi:hypothetical protein